MKISTRKDKPIKGYSQLSNGKFMVRIRINKKQTNLGCFKTEEEAMEIYIQAKAKLLINIEVE